MVLTMYATEKAKLAGLTLKSTDYRQPCPQCSHLRTKKKDPCCHVTWEPDGTIKAKCFHCPWGMTFSDDDETRRRPEFKRRGTRPGQGLRQRSARGW